MKPILLNLETNEEFRCTGVPEGLARAQPVVWAHSPGGAGKADFLRTPPGKFVLEMSVEGFELGRAPQDVRPQLVPIEAAIRIGRAGTPPPFLLTWGSVRFPIVVEHLEIVYTRFDPAGFPTSARVKLQLAELVDRKRIEQAVIGTVGAVVRPVVQMLQQMNAQRQSLERVARSYADGAKREIDGVRAEARRAEGEIRRSVADVEREAKKVEKEVKEKADALEKGIRDAETQIKKETEERVKAIEAEGEKAYKQVESQVDTVQKEIVRPVEDLRRDVNGAVDEKLKEVEGELADYRDRIALYPSEIAARVTEQVESLRGDLTDIEKRLRDAGNASEEQRREFEGELKAIKEKIESAVGLGELKVYKEFDNLIEGFEKYRDTMSMGLTASFTPQGLLNENLSIQQTEYAKVALDQEWKRLGAELRFPYRPDDWNLIRLEFEERLRALALRTRALLNKRSVADIEPPNATAIIGNR